VRQPLMLLPAARSSRQRQRSRSCSRLLNHSFLSPTCSDRKPFKPKHMRMIHCYLCTLLFNYLSTFNPT